MTAEIILFPEPPPYLVGRHIPERREHARRLFEICKRMTHSDAEAARWTTGLLKECQEAANRQPGELPPAS